MPLLCLSGSGTQTLADAIERTDRRRLVSINSVWKMLKYSRVTQWLAVATTTPDSQTDRWMGDWTDNREKMPNKTHRWEAGEKDQNKYSKARDHREESAKRLRTNDSNSSKKSATQKCEKKTITK